MREAICLSNRCGNLLGCALTLHRHGKDVDPGVRAASRQYGQHILQRSARCRGDDTDVRGIIGHGLFGGG